LRGGVAGSGCGVGGGRGTLEESTDVNDQRDATVAENRAARHSADLWSRFTEVFDDNLLLPEDFVDKHARSALSIFENEQETLLKLARALIEVEHALEAINGEQAITDLYDFALSEHDGELRCRRSE
jgi:hypothetical protein